MEKSRRYGQGPRGLGGLTGDQGPGDEGLQLVLEEPLERPGSVDRVSSRGHVDAGGLGQLQADAAVG